MRNTQSPALLDERAIEQLKTGGEYQSFLTAFAKAKYAFEADENDPGKYRATNHAHDFQVAFTSEGVELSAKNGTGKFASAWRLKSFGHGEQQTIVESGLVKAAEQRIEIACEEQGVTEWYENKPEGLEYGFTLAKNPPIAADNGARLRLKLQIEGELGLRNTADKQSIELVDDNGQKVMSYTGLRAWDAMGQELTATMQAATNEVWLDVGDETAVYPLTIAPTFVQRAKLSANDATHNNLFGDSISMSGDTIIVGAPYTEIGGNNGQGAAYVFVRSGTNWIQQAKLTANDGRREDLFGRSVAIDGDMAIVGAPFADLAPECGVAGLLCNEGAAYVFVRNGVTWTEQQKVISIDPAMFELFGHKVKIENNTAVISEHLDDVEGTLDRGRINIYTRTDTQLALQQRLTSDSPAVGLFGMNLDLDRDTIVVGAVGGSTGGAAYVFVRSGTTWTQQQKLLASDGEPGNAFGFSVAVDGNTIVIGDYFDDIGGNSNQGSAYVFTRTGDLWTQRQKLTAGNGRAGDKFGYDVGVSGETIVVSASHERVGINDYQGAAYVYIYNGASWTERQKLTAADGVADSLFGHSVVISGNTIIISALKSASPGPPAEQGAAYIFNALVPKPAPFDFDGDGKTDFSVFRPSNGFWYFLRSSNNAFQAIHFGSGGDLTVPVDFDGDGKTDIAVFRPSSAGWYWLNSTDNSFQGAQFGAMGDIPVPADFDGDGRADLTVFRPSNGTWYRINSITNQLQTTQFGLNGDIPLPADFDGDRHADLNVFRPSNGTWYRINSINNGFVAAQFGMNGDLPVPADFDGDGRADLNVFRPSEGIWYRINSSPGCAIIFVTEENSDSTNSQAIPGCFVVTRFGVSEDRPLVGDFNGDGRADISVFRPSSGTWYRLTTPPNSFSAIQFGMNGDVAVPASFVP